MREQVGQSYLCTEADGVICALAPLRERGVERLSPRFDVVTEGYEQSLEERLPATAGDSGEHCLQRDRRMCQFRSFLALAHHRAPKNLPDCDTQKRRRDVRAVADVVHERRAPPAHQSDRVHIKQEGCRAARLTRLRIEDVCLSN